MNYKKIQNDFNNLEKSTESLINKYNRSVDSIKNQELAIDKVKNKLTELINGNKTPTSVKNLETELKKAEEEISNLQTEYEDVVDQMETKKLELTMAKNLGNDNRATAINIEQENLDTKTLDIADKLENAKERADKLKATLKQVKLNPNNSIEVQELSKKLEIAENKLLQAKESADKLKNEIADSFNEKKNNFGNIKDVNNNIERFGKRISGLIASVAIFNLLSSSLTKLRDKFFSLLNTNDTFNATLNQIKANLMTAFAPIYNACLPAINSLMNALSKVTGTLALFISGLFGKSIGEAKNQAKGLSNALDKTAKSGKKANDSLSSLDEIEVLNDNNSSDGGSSGDSGINYDGEIQYSQKLLDFLNKIKDFISQNSDYILAFFGGLVAGLLALKLGLTGIQSLGIGLLISGIILLIEGIIGYLNDPSWKNFGKVISGIGLIIAGIAILFGAWPVAVAGALIAIIGLIISNWQQIKTFLQGGIEWLKTSGKEILNWLFGDFLDPIYDAFVDNLQLILDFFDITFTNAKVIFDNLIDFIKNVFTGNWKGAWENIKNIFITIFDTIKSYFFMIFNIIKNTVVGIGATVGNIIAGVFKTVVNGVMGAIESILNSPIKSINKLIKSVNKVPGISLGTISTFNLPRLATGAVIPPRQEFAAVLGDQKHGTNIETPENLLRKIVKDESNNQSIDSNEIIQLLIELNKNILEISKSPTVLNVNGKEFAQATYHDYQNEKIRQQHTTAVKRS